MKIYINILANKNLSIPTELSNKFPILDKKLIELWNLNMIDGKKHSFKLGVNQQVTITPDIEVFNCICEEVDTKGNTKLNIIALGICLEQAIIKLNNVNTQIIIHDKYEEDVLPILKTLKIINNVDFVNKY